ncbi:DUF4292 domain-containing protein [bacterium]|nr:DUF4292 domain-containing protein [bacterium]
MKIWPNTSFAAAFLLAAILLFNACAPTIPPKSVITVGDLTAEDIWDRVEQNSLKINTLKCSGNLQVQMPGTGYTAKGSVQVIMPNLIYLKVEATLFGLDVGTFTSNGKRFALYAPQQKAVYLGDVATVNLSTFFQINLSYDEFKEAITGQARIPEGVFKSLAVDNDQFLVIFDDFDGTHKYWVDPVKMVVTEYQLVNEDGLVELSKKFMRYQKIGDVFFPKMVNLQRIQDQQIFSFFFENIKLNEDVSKEMFKVKVPKGTRPIRL